MFFFFETTEEKEYSDVDCGNDELYDLTPTQKQNSTTDLEADTSVNVENLDSYEIIPLEQNEFPNSIKDPTVKKHLIICGPSQPQGPFPNDIHKNNRSFSEMYYSMVTKSGLRIVRNWLSYSIKKYVVYCLPCWIFPQKGSSENPWNTSGINDWKHLSERIKSHETSVFHIDSCTVYEIWRKNKTFDIVSHKSLREEHNFWRKVLERILDVTMMLPTCNLAFRGSKENIEDEDSNKGNFLSVIALLAKYDPILSESLAQPAGSIKYLSHQIQNEVISLLGQEVHDNIVRNIKDAPFFSFILDTTQDESKID